MATRLGLALAGWLSVAATATLHDESRAFAIYLAISWIPAVILSIGLFFVWRYPLDECSCAIITRRLQRRTQRDALIKGAYLYVSLALTKQINKTNIPKLNIKPETSVIRVSGS